MSLLNVSAWPRVVCNKRLFDSTMSFPAGVAAGDLVQKELCAAATEYQDLPERIINTLSFTDLMEELVDPVCSDDGNILDKIHLFDYEHFS